VYNIITAYYKYCKCFHVLNHLLATAHDVNKDETHTHYTASARNFVTVPVRSYVMF